MSRDRKPSTHEAWTRFRFAVVGPLLSAPPRPGELQREIEVLAKKSWRHPTTEKPVTFGASTIERWYYIALRAKQDPFQALRRRVRKDLGKRRRMSDGLAESLRHQHRLHPGWTYQLHADNLGVRVEKEPKLGPMPSYPTIVRFMRSRGLFKKPRPRNPNRPGLEAARAHLEAQETRSFERDHVGSLFHLDFHNGSLAVLAPSGVWVTPIALGILDDYSRLGCHVQWYFSQTAEDLVHGLSQAFQKRGLPGELLTDNGSAMTAEETTSGLARLSITHSTTFPYCPNQNGKQEAFWGTLESRLVSMLGRKKDLTIDFLNLATQPWVELEYNRKVHSETGEKPIDRFLNGPDVSRVCPSSEALRLAFRLDDTRTQRRSDGTISLEGIRFEIPSRYRHLERLTVRYARWNLSLVHLVDPRTGALLSPIYPIDKQRNADGQRRALSPIETPGVEPDPGTVNALPTEVEEIPPLLEKLMADYAATGLPPGYIPKRAVSDETDSEQKTRGSSPKETDR